MTALLSASGIADAFISACHAELSAIKAGNVHVHADGHGMEVAQFEAAAAAAAPHLANDTLPVGARILHAVTASFAAAGCNTNLGILLLCAPLAVAASRDDLTGDLQARLGEVLNSLDQADARDVFAAIAHANPGGLGKVENGDVAKPPSMSLMEAMTIARDRDRIAKAYTDGYADIFGVALPRLAGARSEERSEEDAIASLHMTLLARFPDSHIARKYGAERAEEVRATAAVLVSRIFPMTSRDARDRLLAFDAALKNEQINPGTTADLVVATLFADTLNNRGRHTAAV
jgi:triphosphoribosyl-dephospho-CoA synthase